MYVKQRGFHTCSQGFSFQTEGPTSLCWEVWIVSLLGKARPAGPMGWGNPGHPGL